MKLLTFSKKDHLKEKIELFLLNYEAQNCIFISALLQSNENALSLGAYFQDSKLEIAWILTLHNILIFIGGSEKAIQLMAEHLSKKNLKIQRIRGPSASIDILMKLEKFELSKSMIQNIYELDFALPLPSKKGQLRKAEYAEIAQLSPWIQSYITETKLDSINPDSLLKTLIGQERLYIWEYNKTILSIAAYTGPTFTGIRINLVFTPSHYRGNGYATSCIQALWDQLMIKGYSKCFIFADHENLASNTIYQKMGALLKGTHMDATLN